MVKFKIRNPKSKINPESRISSKFQFLNFQTYKFGLLGICSLIVIWNLTLGAWNLPNSFAQENIVAIVNDEAITQKDLNEFTNFMRMQLSGELEGEKLQEKIDSMRQDLLNKLIEDRLILQEAKKNKINVDENRVKAKIDEVKKRYSTDSEFQAALIQQGLVQADLEERLREQLLMFSIIDIQIKRKIMIKPSEVTEFYQDNIEEFKIPEEREFITLTLKDKALAQEISVELKKGADFAETAKKYSLEPGDFAAKKGEELKEELEKVVFQLNPQDISEPLQVGDAFYIFKLVKITPFQQLSLIEAQDRIRELLFNKKMQEGLVLWLEGLKKSAYVKIFSS